MKKSFFPVFRRSRASNSIIVVSGLPRSGTSMMMKMLEAGGISPLTDKTRKPDEDNPQGYYEFERVKKLKEGDTDWLPKARGKAVKIVAALVPYLPDSYHYKVILMNRAMPEVLVSQQQMLLRRGEDTNEISEEEMTRLFEKHLQQTKVWVEQQSNIQLIVISYNELLQNPDSQIARIEKFLCTTLDIGKMKAVIDPNLYRQRRGKM